jgi:hypothetical protein
MITTLAHNIASVLRITINNFLNSLKNHPNQKIVNALLDDGNVETLTGLKVVLVLECRKLSGFPASELYTGRKPKYCSQFIKSLEESLANDILQIAKVIIILLIIIIITSFPGFFSCAPGTA